MSDKDTSIIDYLHILMKWRKFAIRNMVAVCILAAVISLILPKWYTAKTTVLPPEEQGLGLGLSSMLASLPMGTGMLPGMTAPGAFYVAILNSRTVGEAVIRKLNLQQVYRAKNMEEALEKLRDRTQTEISEEGVVALKATARSPQLAADIANTFVAELDKKNAELSMTQARNNRLFIEGRLAVNKADMARAEEELRQFQVDHKAIALPEQTAAAIEAAALLMGEKQMLEIKKDVLLSTMTATNPQVVQVQIEIDALQRQLDVMEFGTQTGQSQTEPEQDTRHKELYVPFAQVPKVGLQLARLLREVKIQEVIFELLMQQYEQAKLQEAKDTPTVQILDGAVAPISKSRPKRAIIVVIAALSSLFIMVVCILLYERVLALRQTDPDKYERISQLFRTARSDLKIRPKAKTT